MMAQKLRFSRGLKLFFVWKRKCPAPSLLVFPLRRRSSKYLHWLQARRPSTEHKKQQWWRSEFFFFYLRWSFKCMIVILPTFWRSAPAWSSLDSWLAMFHSRRCSYIRTDDPSTKTGAHCELEHRGLRSQQFCERCGYFFFHQAPPSAVSSPSQSSPSFPSHSLSTRRNQLSPRSPSSRKPSTVQIVPACVASGNIHNAVSRHLDKNRAKHRRTVFSMNKAQESKQRSTNWRRRHLGDMQQQPRRWPDYDKSEETKLR